MASKKPALAGHTLATPDLTLDEAFTLFAELGLGGVEILQADDYRCALPEQPTLRTLERMRSRLDSLALEVALVTPYIRTLDALEPEIRSAAIAALRTAIDTASALAGKGVRVLAGRRDGPAPQQRRERFVATLQEVAPQAEDLGIVLAIESKGWSFAYDTANMLDLVEAADSAAVGILFDPANLVLDGIDPVTALDSQAPLIRHIHVKDVRPGPDAQFVPAPLGTGVVPWRDLFRTLVGIDYRGWLSLEYERRWHPDTLPEARSGLAAELGFIDRTYP